MDIRSLWCGHVSTGKCVQQILNRIHRPFKRSQYNFLAFPRIATVSLPHSTCCLSDVSLVWIFLLVVSKGFHSDLEVNRATLTLPYNVTASNQKDVLISKLPLWVHKWLERDYAQISLCFDVSWVCQNPCCHTDKLLVYHPQSTISFL